MNFKRFNGSTWETVQHKIYGSGTDSLTAFPAVIQASGEALTDYTISGNTLQDGTPTPEAPVEVVGCGVWDETYQSYKLPPTVNGTEYPIYLGQVETTRRIKMLELTGEENWAIDSGRFALIITDIASQGLRRTKFYCSSYIVISDGRDYADVPNNAIYTGGGGPSGTYVYIHTDEYATTTSFKAYLAQQHANGTPVTIWYALKTPETGIVNEPLMKIGGYADTVSYAQAGVTIPTSDGDNTITFGTTVQPSAMSATFNGWHPVQGAKQYDGSEWR